MRLAEDTELITLLTTASSRTASAELVTGTVSNLENTPSGVLRYPSGPVGLQVAAFGLL